ncbi:MAG: hypothetical protein ACYSWU_07780 [Planctomycetota bacterium]
MACRLSGARTAGIGVDFNFNVAPTPGIGGPGMVFGRPDPNRGFGEPLARNVMDVDGGRGVVVGLAAPGVFTPDLSIPFRQGGFGLAVPQFGGFAPGAGMTSGFQVRGRRGNASFFWEASQGSRQSLVSQTPSVTLTNGYPGSISDTSQSPFVVGVIPVVGGFVRGFPIGYAPQYTMGYPIPPMGRQYQMAPRGDSPVRAMLRQIAAESAQKGGDGGNDWLAGLPGGGPVPPRPPRPQGGDRPAPIEPSAALAAAIDPGARKLAVAQSSSAGRAVPSVAEARRLHQLEQAGKNDEAMVYYEKALGAEEGGKPGVAKIWYNMALKRANGDLRNRILARLKALSSPDTPK